MDPRLKRRNFLRGAFGISLGLPFLETFAPRTVRAADMPKRLAVFYCCNGVLYDKWYPTTDFGALTAQSLAGTGLQPLAAHTDKITVARGIHGAPRGLGSRTGAGDTFAGEAGPGDDHERGVSTRLTASPLANTVEKYATGISIDQVIARAVNPGGRGPLNLMVGSLTRGARGGISYTGPQQQASPFQDPYKAYKDWVGAAEAALPSEMVDRAVTRRKSVLDLVRTDFEALKNHPALSQQDRAKLDLHFSSIRDVEVHMTAAGLPLCNLPDARRSEIEAIDPTTVTLDSEYEKIGGMLMDVMALALACDQNRVVTLQWGSGALGPIFSWLPPMGFNDRYSHHKLTHGSSVDSGSLDSLPTESWQAAVFNIDQWYAKRLSELIDKLSAYSEPGGTLLDNSSVLYMNDVANGLTHSYVDLPVMLIGGLQGYFKQGQHINVSPGNPVANEMYAPSNMLCTTLANAMGVPMTDFGSAATGKPGELGELKR
jgi:hypothetical protein